MVWGLLRSSSTASTSASPALTAAAAPHVLVNEAKLHMAPEVAKLSPVGTRPEDSDAEEELDWELVESARADSTADHLPVDGEYLVVESTSGEASSGEAGVSESMMATPRNSSDEGQVKRQETEASQELAASYKESPASSCPTTPRPPPESPTALGTQAPEKACSARGDAATDDVAKTPSEDEDQDEEIYRCKGCSIMVFKAKDIISSNYHAQTSPGYLLGRILNISVSDKVEQAKYTTGTYDIKEVSCAVCNQVFGVTYCKSHNVEYRYKEGKFLIGSDRLKMPTGVDHPMNKKA